MATTEERLQILKMIQDGKITAEEGAQLIEALEQKKTSPQQDASQAAEAARNSARWFRVRVTETGSGKTRVNVRMPVGLINAGLKMGAKFSPEVEGLDVQQIMQFVNSGEVGQVVDVYDDEDGEHIEVFIE